jgi:hypothetical protein
MKKDLPKRKCKVRIDIRRFESIIVTEANWHFARYNHCLN